MSFRKNPGIVQSEIAGEVVLMGMGSERYYALDQIASRIWVLLDFETTLEGLCERLMDEYDVDGLVCRQDVGEHLQKLAKMGLITMDTSTL